MLKFFCTVIICSIVCCTILAQSGGINSPFSRFGIGDLVDPNLIYLRQMGGINAAYADNYHINHVNPASLPFLRATSFDIGLAANYRTLTDDTNTTEGWSGKLEYLSLAFPLRNPLNEVFDREVRDLRFGMGFSLLPVSRVSYLISKDASDDQLGDFTRDFRGSGGSYKVQWGNGVKYKNFYGGVNLGYVFGKINYERNLEFENLNTFDIRFSNNYSLRGFQYNLGFIYQLFLNKEQAANDSNKSLKAINFGIYANSATSLSIDSEELFINQFGAAFTGSVTDTLSFETGIQRSGTLPGQLGLGMTYFKGGSLSLSLNYVLTRWSQYKNEANPETLSDTYKLSFGGFYRPNTKSFKYRNRVFYRFGGYIGKDPISIDDNQLSMYGATLGFGLPFVYQRKISHINLGLEVGQRSVGNILRETFVKLGVGLTFNDDEWFIKRKYN